MITAWIIPKGSLILVKDHRSTVQPVRSFAVPISWKLLGATAIVGAVAAVIAVIGLRRIQTLNANLTQTVEFLSTKVKLASLIKQDLVTATRAERNLILARSEDEMRRFTGVVDVVVAAMERRLEELRGLVAEEDQRQLDQFSATFAQWLENHQDVRRFVELNSAVEARQLSFGESSQAIDEMMTTLDKIRDHYQTELASANSEQDAGNAAIAAEGLSQVARVRQAALEMQRAEKDLILASTEEELRSHDAALSPRKEKLQSEIQRLTESLGSEDQTAAVDVQSAFEKYLDVNGRIRAIAGEKGNIMAQHFVYEFGAPLAARCESLLDGLIERSEDEMQQHQRTSQKMYVDSRNTLLAVSIFGILVSVTISFYTGQRIARRLKRLSNFVLTIQETGDLSKPTPRLGRDEVGRLASAFDRMRSTLHDHTVSLREQAARLADLTLSLEEKNKEMEQFVYTVSHDLKSPLVSCKGLLGLLLEDLESQDFEAVADSAQRLDRATNQLNQIIDDLLLHSRIGRKSQRLTEVNVNELLSGLLDQLADRVETAGAQVATQPHLPKVIADETDLLRVFENLITNSLKYGCDQPNSTIEIGGVRDHAEVCFYVRDEGRGIDPQYHERVFGLFQRLDVEQDGTGVGLASVAKIMNIYGGRAWVDSALGEGATFWIAFPNRGKAS